MTEGGSGVWKGTQAMFVPSPGLVQDWILSGDWAPTSAATAVHHATLTVSLSPMGALWVITVTPCSTEASDSCDFAELESGDSGIQRRSVHC